MDFAEEPEVENGWQIWGIQLKDSQLPELKFPKGFKETEVDKNASLPDVKLAYGQAIIKGYILDYREGMPNKLSLSTIDIMGGNGGYEIEIAPDGSFSHTLDVLGALSANLIYNNEAVSAMMLPGETSEMCINIREQSRKRSKYHVDAESYGQDYYYNGPLADVMRIFPEMQRKFSQIRDEMLPIEKKAELSLTDYRKQRLEVLQIQKDSIARMELSDGAKAFLVNQKTVDALFDLRLAANDLTSAYQSTKGNQITREEASAYFQKLTNEVASMPDYFLPAEISPLLNQPQTMLSSY